jgi:hypothetical protein
MALEHDPEGTDPISSLALTLLAVVEAQAKIVGDLAARIDALEAPST